MVAALFLGGAEKLRGEAVRGVAQAAEAGGPNGDGESGGIDGPDGAARGVLQDAARVRLAGDYGLPLLFPDELAGVVAVRGPRAGSRAAPPSRSCLPRSWRRCGAAARPR